MSKDMDMMERPPATLMPVTIRFTPDAWQALRDTAHQEGVAVAEIARLAITGKLGDYFGTVKCLDRAQASEIRMQVAELGNAVSRIGIELNRIGINYNQEVRALNELVKSGTTAAGRNTGPALSKPELERLLKEYKTVSEKVGELLCLIRV